MRSLPPSLYLKALRPTATQGAMASDLVTVLCLRSKVQRTLWGVQDALEGLATSQEVE